MPQPYVNLVKLCVGADQVSDLTDWQSARFADTGTPPRHVTRMWPKRADELLNGGSLYWVFKGLILARQRIVALDEVPGSDGITRCGIVLERDVVLTESVPRRPFQGWRYLSAADAPRDLTQARAGDDTLPPSLSAALADIGVR